jgi:23S rRNA (pseudouridine1915-N3)-methyltransferase
MKKVNIIAVGGLKDGFYISAAAEYVKRLSRFCELRITELDEFAEDEGGRESDAVLSALKGKRFWLLDIEGTQSTSEGFAELLDKAFLTGEVTFVIGGSRGVNARVRAAADKKISFGRFTYPHRLMRVMLLEQLYRAFTIIAGLPYHK